MLTLNDPKKPLKLEKEENADHLPFLLFLQCILTYDRQISHFKPHLNRNKQMILISTSLNFNFW